MTLDYFFNSPVNASQGRYHIRVALYHNAFLIAGYRASGSAGSGERQGKACEMRLKYRVILLSSNLALSSIQTQFRAINSASVSSAEINS